MDLQVFPDGTARFGPQSWPCRLGRTGVTTTKREGDGATPVGVWSMRGVLYRPDRLIRPATALPTRALAPDDGWCDDPGDPGYNRPVKLPYPGRCEPLWREDAVYDIIVPLSYNDAPVVAGRGSAIFLHVARVDGGPTEGCVALELPHLLAFLEAATGGTRVIVRQ
jgi:L,D-peptidoglycan transpeptidase YkuD (ErfK/YbiS/YcfS/YnhG family)